MSSNALYNRIKELCDKKGVKGGRVCEELGISKGLLTDLNKGRRSGMSAATAQKFASYFGVTVGYLLGEEKINEATMDETKSKEEISIDVSKNVLYDKITELCNQRGITRGALCAEIGMSKGILTDLKMGRQSGLSSSNLKKISTYFGVSVGYLLGEEEKSVSDMSYSQAANILSELVYDKEFVELYESYKKLEKKKKKVVRVLIDALIT